jgi:hypothetical protein
MKKSLSEITAWIGKNMVIHPVLFAIFPILFLYKQNIDETTALSALSPLWFIVPGTIVLWVLFYIWMKNIFKAGLATTLVVILFLFYGRFYSSFESRGVHLPSHSIFLPLFMVVWGYLIYFIKIYSRDLRNFTQVLNAISVILILLNLFNIVSYQIGKPATAATTTAAQVKAPATNIVSKATQPDIYWIVLDEYAAPGVMKDVYKYDDSEFLNKLKKQGFYVASDSQTHSNETIRAVASVLNMEESAETESAEVTYSRIENNAVVDFLHSKNYQYVYLGQWYEEDRYTIPADIYFNFYKAAEKGQLTTEYSSILWNTTALSPFYYHIFGDEYEGYYRDSLLKTLNQLAKVPQIPGPKFTYAHIICPHAPFVFGPNGEQVPSTEYYNADDQRYYLGQYIFISRQIDKVIQQILDHSATDPIIILQSDHGPRWTNDWSQILNAYHLPGDGKSHLYPDISPVNSFRLIFNHYFDANYEILEDQ